MMIIAFAGPAGAGKSTLAKQLVRKYGAAIHSFAKPLRDEVVAAGFPSSDVWRKPTPDWVRKLLQAWGEARRMVYEDYWADKMWVSLEHTLVNSDVGPQLVAIDDLRYPNELEILEDFYDTFGVPYRTVRIINNWNKTMVPNHSSETALSRPDITFDRVFVNEYDEFDHMTAFLDELVGEMREFSGDDGSAWDLEDAELYSDQEPLGTVPIRKRVREGSLRSSEETARGDGG